ncbi:uroplakin-3b [Ictalurus punctatus]|uniref:Uroplakin-3b n=1 Tax=Ictalurus punctatus TaxID=7998 RepID=A0A2D0QF08_ICTPU|nr:uroplakin-3b [Ictalurus punctatus]
MKSYLVVCWLYMMLLDIFPDTFQVASVLVQPIPTLSQDVVVPVTTNTVYLQKPFCYFQTVSDPLCDSPNTCSVWLVSALSTAKGTFDSDKTAQGFVNVSPYPTAFSPGAKNYFMTKLNPQTDYPCPPFSTPTTFQVGAEGTCSSANCNGVLPNGSTMSFKYVLVSADNTLVAETNWSDNITLNTVKDPNSLGSGYAGRSAAMVVITAILATAAALLLLLLLIALILACCYSRGKTQSSGARRQTSLIGSLRIPSYDLHHLKKPSPYDNPVYEQDLRRKYTTNPTLPQKTTTVITTVNSDSPGTITTQKM